MLCIVLHYCQSAFEQFWKMRYTKVNLLLLLLLTVREAGSVRSSPEDHTKGGSQDGSVAKGLDRNLKVAGSSPS